MKLGVNVDHVATLRQARRGTHPDPVEAAKICKRSGASSIVMHLREDRRHIQDTDLFRLRRAVSIRLNLEMSLAPSIVKVAERLRPDQVTLVPERRQEMTTESGLDLFFNRARLEDCIRRMRRRKIEVSLFIDPDRRQLKEAVRLGADAVEFHTGAYADARTAPERRRQLARLKDAAQQAKSLGILAHAGHGLDYRNVGAVRTISELHELNIGYSIVCRALWVGLERAVRDMVSLIR